MITINETISSNWFGLCPFPNSSSNEYHEINLAVTQHSSPSLGFSHTRIPDLLMTLALISETTEPWSAVDYCIFCLAGILLI